MDNSLLEFIQATVDLRDSYYYFKDKYALDLLTYSIEEKQVSINQLKKSRWGFLFQKKVLQKITAQLPDQKLDKRRLTSYWPWYSGEYRLSLGKWGEYSKHRNDDWYQTSRPGVNLVLQLNFGEEHNLKYYKLIFPSMFHPFVNLCHPIAEKGLTLAWARMDIDFDTGEVLIEEIQTDWLRSVKKLVATLARGESYWKQYYPSLEPTHLRHYYQEEVYKHEKVWDEAMLAAALWFVKRELGLAKVYYHTFDTGNIMKQLTYSQPPRSLYTKLPRRFGFRETEEAPQFLRKEHYLKRTFKKHPNLKWFVLNLESHA